MGILDIPGVPRSAATAPGDLYGLDATGQPAGLHHQLAYAEDLSGIATAINTAGAETTIYGVAITVPATPRNVMLRFNSALQITAAGNGAIFLSVYEITSGSSVVLNGMSLTGGFTAGAGSQYPTFGAGAIPLGPITTPRQFRLSAVILRDASSTLAASVRSASSGVPFSWLEAVAQ